MAPATTAPREQTEAERRLVAPELERDLAPDHAESRLPQAVAAAAAADPGEVGAALGSADLGGRIRIFSGLQRSAGNAAVQRLVQVRPTTPALSNRNGSEPADGSGSAEPEPDGAGLAGALGEAFLPGILGPGSAPPPGGLGSPPVPPGPGPRRPATVQGWPRPGVDARLSVPVPVQRDPTTPVPTGGSGGTSDAAGPAAGAGSVGTTPAQPEPQQFFITGSSFDGAAREMATAISRWPVLQFGRPDVKLVVADGVVAALYDKGGTPIGTQRYHFSPRVPLPAGVHGMPEGPQGTFHPVMLDQGGNPVYDVAFSGVGPAEEGEAGSRPGGQQGAGRSGGPAESTDALARRAAAAARQANDRIAEAQQARQAVDIPHNVLLTEAFTEKDAFVRAVGGVPVILVVPSAVASNQPPAGAFDEDVPDFLRSGNAQAKPATARAWPAEMQPVSGYPTSVSGGSSTMQMLLHPENRASAIDALGLQFAPISFRWQVARIKPSDDNMLTRLASEVEESRQDVEAGQVAAEYSTAGDVTGGDVLRERLRTRVHNIDEDANEIRGSGGLIRSISAETLATFRTGLAAFAEPVHMFVAALVSSDSNWQQTQELPWREPGLYFIAASAHDVGDWDNGGHRAPSYVNAVVLVRDPRLAAQTATTEQQGERERELRDIEQRRDQELRLLRNMRDLLAQAVTARGIKADTRAELQRELDRLNDQLPEREAYYTRLHNNALSAVTAVGDARASLDSEAASMQFQIELYSQMIEGSHDEQLIAQVRRARDEYQHRLEANRSSRRGLDAPPGQVAPGAMSGVLVDQRSGSQRNLYFTVTETTSPDGGDEAVTVTIKDVSDAEGNTFRASGADRAAAFNGALADLRTHLSRGRGFFSFIPEAPYTEVSLTVPNPMELRAGAADQVSETVDDFVTFVTVAALLAAPFTGGATLGIIEVVSIAGALTASYRLVTRITRPGEFRLDFGAFMDIVTVATVGLGGLTKVAGVASAGAKSAKLAVLAERLAYMERGGKAVMRILHGANYLMIPAPFIHALMTTDDPASLLEAFLNMLVQAGATVGSEAHQAVVEARQQQAGAAGGRRRTAGGSGERTAPEGGRTTTAGEPHAGPGDHTTTPTDRVPVPGERTTVPGDATPTATDRTTTATDRTTPPTDGPTPGDVAAVAGVAGGAVGPREAVPAGPAPADLATLDAHASGTTAPAPEVTSALQRVLNSVADWKGALRELLADRYPTPEARGRAEVALDQVRRSMVREVIAEIEGAYEVKASIVGQESFGSDIDINWVPRDPTAPLEDLVRSSTEASNEFSRRLRERVGGRETDTALDTNSYSYIGQRQMRGRGPTEQARMNANEISFGMAAEIRGRVEAGVPLEEALGAVRDESRAGAEQAIEGQGWGATRGRRARGLMDRAIKDARAFFEQMRSAQAQAEAMVDREHPNIPQDQRARLVREALLNPRKVQLAEMLGMRTPDPEAIVRLQSEIRWFEPEAYVTESAFENAVVYGQGRVRPGGAPNERPGFAGPGRIPPPATEGGAPGGADAPLDRSLAEEGAMDPATRRARLVGALGDNLGALESHVAHAETPRQSATKAAKYAGRMLTYIRFLFGTGAHLDAVNAHPVARALGEFIQSRWPSDVDVPRPTLDGLVRAWAEQTSARGPNGEPVVDPATSEVAPWAYQAFADSVQAFARDQVNFARAAEVTGVLATYDVPGSPSATSATPAPTTPTTPAGPTTVRPAPPPTTPTGPTTVRPAPPPTGSTSAEPITVRPATPTPGSTTPVGGGAPESGAQPTGGFGETHAAADQALRRTFGRAAPPISEYQVGPSDYHYAETWRQQGSERGTSELPPGPGYTYQDRIYLSPYAGVPTATHESLHLLSPESWRTSVPTFLNEGITELFTERAVGRSESSSYDRNVELARRLESVVGREVLERAYFEGDVGALRDALEPVLGDRSRVDDFFTLMKLLGDTGADSDLYNVAHLMLGDGSGGPPPAAGGPPPDTGGPPPDTGRTARSQRPTIPPPGSRTGSRATGEPLAGPTGDLQTVPPTATSGQSGESRRGPAIEDTDYGVRGTWSGDNRAVVRFERNEDIGGVDITDVFRGTQPPGSGGRMIAETLRGARETHPEVIRISRIMDTQPTTEQLARGVAPADTVLGRTLASAVAEMGGTITEWAHGVERGKPWIQVRVRY